MGITKVLVGSGRQELPAEEITELAEPRQQAVIRTAGWTSESGRSIEYEISAEEAEEAYSYTEIGL